MIVTVIGRGHGGTRAGILGFGLARIAVRPESVGRWRTSDKHRDIDFLREDIERLGYDAQKDGCPT